jgi:peptidoglycan/xylan/chitin deacetylase (PgdA/CDA1 family)
MLKKISVKENGKENKDDAVVTTKAKSVDVTNTSKQNRKYTEEQRPVHYLQDRLPYTFSNGTTSKKLISLTFDGGSFSNCTKDILDTLKSRNVTATMFLTGYYIQRNKELVRRMIAEGHDIGNHTTTHPHLTTWAMNRWHNTLPEITETFICNELDKTNLIFKKITQLNLSPFWRAPYGETNNEINKWALNCGYLHIGWKQARRWKDNYDTNDWVPNPETPGYYTPQQVIDKFSILSEKKPYGMNGAIILMHLGTVRKNENQQIHTILGTIIDSLQKKSYEFVTISVLLEKSNVPLHLL